VTKTIKKKYEEKTKKKKKNNAENNIQDSQREKVAGQMTNRIKAESLPVVAINSEEGKKRIET
jgi:hypothetical protein